MGSVEVVADLGRRHLAGDVYDLWLDARETSLVVGWDRYDGGQLTYNVLADGRALPVGRPRSSVRQGEAYTVASCEGGQLCVRHLLDARNGSSRFHIECTLPDGEKVEFRDDVGSLLFPAVCADDHGNPWVAWVRCSDVVNDDGVIDQHNQIACAHLRDGEWIQETVADLRYGLLPLDRGAGVWGYPGRRRRPYVVPDDSGGVWVIWERKEPPDGGTTRAHGSLCGRRCYAGTWQDPIKLIDDVYMDFYPALRGVVEGKIAVAAQKGNPFDGEPGRGEVVVLSADVTEAEPLAPAVGFEQWQPIDLVNRVTFTPTRELAHKGETFQLLFGDPHTHTGLSGDAEGDFTEMLAYARDRAKLDFVAFTDNDWYQDHLSDRDWQRTMTEDQAWSVDGRFIAVPGYEWTQPRWGPTRPQHRSILFESYDQPLLRHRDIEGDPVEALVAWIQTTNGIMNTQHAQFIVTESEREANLEVCCGWGDYINYSECFHEHLGKGIKAGFVGTSDGHRRTPGLGGGLTGVWVREFTLAGIMEAFRQRRCFATAGARVGLRFWVDDTFMGQTTAAGNSHTARIAVEAPREVERLDIIGDGEVVASRSDLPSSFDEEVSGLPECSWYYARVTMPGEYPKYPTNIAPSEGPWAWSSPVFVER